ncbi:MAG TPA: hypothetical protein VGC11_10820 [Acidimicrobiia bacterium]|jgi:DNA-directed RNA polymerase specialized sigma24 family protein
MAIVETAEEAAAPATLESAYQADRATLYRALVLEFANRDVAVEAVDRGFARWHKGRSQRSDTPAQVHGYAYAWAKRRMKRPDRMVQGFRLPAAEAVDDDATVLAAFERLDLVDRSLLVCRHYLGFDEDATSSAIGLDRGEVIPRADAALSRLARSLNGAGGAGGGDRLEAALAAHAATLPEPLERLDSVRSRARLRKVGLAVAGVAAAGVVAAGTAAGVNLLSDEPSTTLAAVGGPDGTEVTGLFTASRLEWTQVGVPIQQGEVISVASGPTGFLALGNDWAGVNGQQNIALLSEDGFVWEAAAGPVQGNTGWVNQVVLAGDQFVAVGSRNDGFGGSEMPLVAISEDGLEWTAVDLPIESEIEVNGSVFDLYTYVQTAASDGTRAVVYGTQNPNFDPQLLLADVLPEDVVLDNWSWSARGVELFDRGGNVERVIPWDDLDIDEATVNLITSGRPVLWTSQDLETWESHVLSGLGVNSWVSSLAAIDDGLAAVAAGQFGNALYVSKDGASWDLADLGEETPAMGAVAAFEGRLLAVGSDSTGAGALWSSADAVTWERIDVGTGNALLERIQVSAGGIAIMAQLNGAQVAGPAVLTVGDVTVQVTQNGGYIVLDGDGTELARLSSEDAIYGNDGAVTLIHPETEEELATFSQAEVDLAWERIWQQFEGGPGANAEYAVLLSEDGEEWNTIALDEIGSGFYPTSVAVGDDALVLTGWSQEGGGGVIIDDFGRGIDGGFDGIGASGVFVWVGTPE